MDGKMRIIVKGLVQGVCFRAIAREVANDLGFTGYVKNLSSGDVEIGLDGNEADVEMLIETIRSRLDLGRIDAIEVAPKTVIASTFEIRT